jgi:hypothetical protein
VLHPINQIMRMKYLLTLVVVFLFNFQSFCQMNKNDSIFNVDLWNVVPWQIPVNHFQENYKYSNGKERIVLVEGDDGFPVEASSYYFDGTLAMHCKLYDAEIDSIKGTSYYFYESANYYPNGKLHEIDINLRENFINSFYDDKGEVFFTQQIFINDTISGVFIQFDEQYNLKLITYNNHKIIGSVTVDYSSGEIISKEKISMRKAKKQFEIFKKTQASPYEGY